MTLFRLLRPPLTGTLINFVLSILLLDIDSGFGLVLCSYLTGLALIVWGGWLVVRYGFGGPWRAATTAVWFVLLGLVLLPSLTLLITNPGLLASGHALQPLSVLLTLAMFALPIAMLFGAFGGLLAAVQAESRAGRAGPEGFEDPDAGTL